MMKFNNSIKNKIIGYFMIVIVVVVLFFEAFTILSVRNYYYSSMAGVLFNQARYNAELYRSNLSDYTLEEVISENKDQFYRNNKAQVQILDNSGLVLFDSIGSQDVGGVQATIDVLEAIAGKGGSATGYVPYHDGQVMSVSYPLKNQSDQVGIIRLTTSLTNVDGLLKDRIAIFLIFGALTISIALLICIIMANSIIRPIKDLIEVATKLADGQFNVKADVNNQDEIGELSRTMNFMSDNIIKKEEIKNDFISSVSHELRTPLTSIRGWAITLQDEVTGDNSLVGDGLKIIEKESDRLSSMVEDLLDFSRFTSGRYTISKETFNLVEIATNINKQLKPKADEKQIDLILNYDNDPIEVIADSNRIKQVFINIIDNALKFTDNGGVIVTNLTTDPNEILIEIIDTGIGISDDEIELVTTKFYKGSSSHSHTGLGLSICEEIIQGHGGRMEILSKLGEGTTVRLYLPRGYDL